MLRPIGLRGRRQGQGVESLTAGLPCVCTTIAAEGIDLPFELAALVADEPSALAALIHRLHEDEAANTSVGDAGRRFMAAYAADDATDAAMRAVVHTSL